MRKLLYLKKLDAAGNKVYTGLAGLVMSVVIIMIVVILRSLIFGA